MNERIVSANNLTDKQNQIQSVLFYFWYERRTESNQVSAIFLLVKFGQTS